MTLTLSSEDKPFKKKVEEIGNYILSGLTEEEAALLIGVSPMQLQMLKDKNPSLEQFLLKKKIKFKEKHLKIIGDKSDPKTSQWLLEKLHSDQFGSRGGRPENPTNVLAIFIKQIQEASPGIVSLGKVPSKNVKKKLSIEGALR